MAYKLSIITVNYNNANGLKRTIKSVVNQSFENFEYIVVDGKSDDSSLSILQRYDHKISKWVSEEDEGIYNAMNKGIEIATGEYILFLNSGDILIDSNVLSNHVNHISEADLIAFDIQMIGQGYDEIKTHPDKLSFDYLFNGTFAHQSIFIKRDLFGIVGNYDESLRIVADWNFFINALVFHKCTYKSVHKILSKYYLDGISSTAEGTFLRRAEREKILKNDFNLFYEDYVEKSLLNTNRFKILKALEKSKNTQKINSTFLRLLLFIFQGKTLKDL